MIIVHKISSSLFHLFFRWQFFFPPAQMIDTIRSPAFIQILFLSFKVRIIQFQNTAVNIMTAGTTERKYFFTFFFLLFLQNKSTNSQLLSTGYSLPKVYNSCFSQYRMLLPFYCNAPYKDRRRSNELRHASANYPSNIYPL